MMISVDAENAIWHDVECGGYGADLALWEELAGGAAWGSDRLAVLELGCGTGRVALHLARRGHAVTGLDRDPELLAALAERAAHEGLEVRTARADAGGFELGERFGLVLAPMQLVQLLAETGRRRMLASVAAHLRPGGLAAFAFMPELPEAWRASVGEPAPAPDLREHDGRVYSSLPLAIEREGEDVAVHRLRQRVSPSGELDERRDVIRIRELPAQRLVSEAGDAGLRLRERREVAATDDHLGSAVFVFEAGR